MEIFIPLWSIGVGLFVCGGLVFLAIFLFLIMPYIINRAAIGEQRMREEHIKQAQEEANPIIDVQKNYNEALERGKKDN